jgi:hypothetical protein
MGISEVKSAASSGSRTRTGFGPASNQPPAAHAPCPVAIKPARRQSNQVTPASPWAAVKNRPRFGLLDPRDARIAGATAPLLPANPGSTKP